MSRFSETRLTTKRNGSLMPSSAASIVGINTSGPSGLVMDSSAPSRERVMLNGSNGS